MITLVVWRATGEQSDIKFTMDETNEMTACWTMSLLKQITRNMRRPCAHCKASQPTIIIINRQSTSSCCKMTLPDVTENKPTHKAAVAAAAAAAEADWASSVGWNSHVDGESRTFKSPDTLQRKHHYHYRAAGDSGAITRGRQLPYLPEWSSVSAVGLDTDDGCGEWMSQMTGRWRTVEDLCRLT